MGYSIPQVYYLTPLPPEGGFLSYLQQSPGYHPKAQLPLSVGLFLWFFLKTSCLAWLVVVDMVVMYHLSFLLFSFSFRAGCAKHLYLLSIFGRVGSLRHRCRTVGVVKLVLF